GGEPSSVRGRRELESLPMALNLYGFPHRPPLAHRGAGGLRPGLPGLRLPSHDPPHQPPGPDLPTATMPPTA
ncbi:MAG TPA: hypothetical protein VNP04_03880, partial [Alphaproteobacteria bacterium]|nr:hypothetical protein [Alphaproteobacteria bacterium]